MGIAINKNLRGVYSGGNNIGVKRLIIGVLTRYPRVTVTGIHFRTAPLVPLCNYWIAGSDDINIHGLADLCVAIHG